MTHPRIVAEEPAASGEASREVQQGRLAKDLAVLGQEFEGGEIGFASHDQFWPGKSAAKCSPTLDRPVFSGGAASWMERNGRAAGDAELELKTIAILAAIESKRAREMPRCRRACWLRRGGKEEPRPRSAAGRCDGEIPCPLPIREVRLKLRVRIGPEIDERIE